MAKRKSIQCSVSAGHIPPGASNHPVKIGRGKELHQRCMCSEFSLSLVSRQFCVTVAGRACPLYYKSYTIETPLEQCRRMRWSFANTQSFITGTRASADLVICWGLLGEEPCTYPERQRYFLHRFYFKTWTKCLPRYLNYMHAQYTGCRYPQHFLVVPFLPVK